MRFTVERDQLADGVSWVARSLSTRPITPVLLGILITAETGQVHLSAFDLEVSGRSQVAADVSDPGTVLVSGRLLVEIVRSLPNKPVEIRLDGAKVSVVCGSSKFTLPTLPAVDYPALPEMPLAAGSIAGDLFSTAVSQVAVAAGRDDSLPVLTGVHVDIEKDRMTLAATDRYRLAVREVLWTNDRPDVVASALVRARTLLDAAKALHGTSSVTIGLSPTTGNEHLIGFAGEGQIMTSRMLDGTFPPYRHLLPSESSSIAVVEVATLMDAVRRVSVVTDRTVPLRLSFSSDVLKLEAGTGEDAQASEEIGIDFEGEQISIAFNPTYLTDGLNALEETYAQLAFTSSGKPAVLSGRVQKDSIAEDSYRYLLMPMRFPN
ncbi:MAG TPA: DNA polymerase III subunit beta [Candidatus Nanopelagicaceae bacterium]|nr:DNA polymerase III subunit beta [Candidatus Nanopelagicaceae bacterium]